MKAEDSRVRFVYCQEDDAVKRISDSLSISEDESLSVLRGLTGLSISNERFSIEEEMPHHLPSGACGFIVQERRYTVDVGKVALTCLLAILGHTPIGSAVSLVADLYEIRKAVTKLDDKEKVLYCFLREVSGNGKTRIKIEGLYESFLSSKGETPLFKSEQQVRGILDSLSEKGLLLLSTHDIKIKP